MVEVMRHDEHDDDLDMRLEFDRRLVAVSRNHRQFAMPILLPSRVTSKTRSSVVGATVPALAAGGSAIFVIGAAECAEKTQR